MTLRSLFALALVALAGCRIEKPSTVVPPAPSIDSFSASAATVARDGKVTLSWKTSNAVAIELREATTGALAVAADKLEGTVEATITSDALFVLTARGAGGSDARAVSVTLDDSGVSAVTFDALPPTIVAGGTTTLVWTAPGATTVSLTAGTQAVDLGGQRNAGAVSVTPSFDTTYTLKADDKTSTVAVTVQPGVLSLDASPRAVEVGDTVTLQWTAGGADHLVITSPGRGQLADITDPARIAAGTFADMVPALPAHSFVAYEVAAVKGTARLAKSVEVYVGTGLEIVRFDAPPVAATGASYSVRWQTIGANQVEVKVDGVTVHRAAPSNLAAGTFAFTSPTQDFAVELVASNLEGARLSRLAQVDAVGVPSAVTLGATPATVTAGQPVTLTWASLEARRVVITDSLGQIVFSTTGQRAEHGTATVHPTADTTWTISADNMLGNPAVTATATATVTGSGVTVTQFPPTALSGQNVELTTSAPMAVLYGFPHARVLESTQADFIDIRSSGSKVIEASDLATVDLAFATFLWGRRTAGPLTISRAGWMAWGTGLSVTASELTLPSTSAPAGIIAPYWDDLVLTANSGVYVQVVGDAPEQQLVVQWDRMQCGTTTGTEATFQARVHQDGRVSFHYRTMTLNSAPSYAVGVQDTARRLAVRSVTAGPPASNTARYFFSPIAAPAEVRVVRGSSWGGYVKVGDAKMLVSKPARSIVIPNDLSLTELMFRPAQAVANGQYIELINRTAEPLDLTGWELRNPAGGAFIAPQGFTLAPSAPYLLGASTDAAANDDAGVMMSWGAFSLSPDAGAFSVGTADASVGYTYSGPADGGFGTALDIDPGPLVGTTGAPGIAACEATTTFGGQTPLQLGSPGVARGCFAYQLTAIPPRFTDISDAGTPIAGGDVVMTPVTLAATLTDPAPVLFGVRTPVISVATNGYILPGSSTSATDTNKVNASSTNPGSLAVFWDDLNNHRPGAGSYWKYFAANEDPATPAAHWVIQWAHHSYYGGTDDMNFEAMLFEDGAVEYHFATMTSGSSSNYAAGTASTTWLENTAGTQALVINRENGLIQSNTAYRFSPR